MRSVVSVFFCVIIVFSQFGCDTDLRVDVRADSDEGDGDSVVYDCSSETHWVTTSGIAPVGGMYLWLGLANRDCDSVVKYSGSEYVSVGQFDGIPLNVIVDRDDSLPGEDFSMRIYGTSNEENIGDISKSIVAGEAGIAQVSDYSSAIDCCDKKYGYAKIRKQSYTGSDVIGTFCHIDTRYGAKVCGDPPYDTAQTHSYILTDISYDTTFVDFYDSTVLNIWASVGYGKYRFSFAQTASKEIFETKFAEIKGYKHHYLIDIYASDPDSIGHVDSGVTYQWRLEQGNTPGIWNMFFEGDTLWTSPSDIAWDGNSGTVAGWGGEVEGFTTDMAGTFSDPCIISLCKWRRIGGTYQDAGFDFVYTPEITNPSEWMMEKIGDATIKVWDVQPRP